MVDIKTSREAVNSLTPQTSREVAPKATQKASRKASRKATQENRGPQPSKHASAPAIDRATTAPLQEHVPPNSAADTMLAQPGIKRRVSGSPSHKKQPSLVQFPDGDEALVLPTFANGAYAKVSAASLTKEPELPKVVRKQRTFARLTHDVSKLWHRIDQGERAKLFSSEQVRSLKVDWDTLELLRDKGRVSEADFAKAESDPGHLTALAESGRLRPDWVAVLTVRHTKKRAAEVADDTQLAVEALNRLPSAASLALSDVLERRAQVDRMFRTELLDETTAVLLKVNVPRLYGLVERGYLSQEQAETIYANPHQIDALESHGQLRSKHAWLLRDTSKFQAQVKKRFTDRLAMLDQLKVKTSYRDAKETAQERRILKRVDSPLSPTNVTVVQGMEYELVPRFDGDAFGLLAQEMPVADRAAVMKALALDVVDALAKAHGENVAHLDIKPENVLVDVKGGKFVVADWGMASEPDANGKLKGTAGTPSYIAPEVFRGVPYDMKADVYSVGQMLWMGSVSQYPLSGQDAQLAGAERADLEKLLAHCTDGQGTVNLASLSSFPLPKGEKREAGRSGFGQLAKLLRDWHALDATFANFAATHMLRLRPEDRLSTKDLAAGLRAVVTPADQARAREVMQRHVPVAAPVSPGDYDTTVQES